MKEMIKNNLAGQNFGKLRVIRFLKTGKRGESLWECLCSCGNNTIVPSASLLRGHTKSCGCLHGETCVMVHTKHGYAVRGIKSSTYKSWENMKSRCLNPMATGFEHYGGRGITVCSEWISDFKNFLMDMGDKPSGMTIDRIDNDKGYFKDNCRWADYKTQNSNRRKRAK